MMIKYRLVLPIIFFCNSALAEDNSSSSAPLNQNPDEVNAEEAEIKARLPLEDLRVFAEAFKRIRSSYVDEINDQELLRYAIRGMLSELDPHSAYLDREGIKDFEESTTGNYGGLGLEIMKEGSFIKVVAPIDGTPASKAGIESGDLIPRLDGSAVKEMSISEAVEIMRGEPDTKIKITILKNGKAEALELELTRQLVKVASVRHRYLEAGFGYLRIAQFQARTAQEVRESVIKLKDEGNLDGLIIDLRNNPGGILRAAVDVADTFLEAGLIVYTTGRLEETKAKYNAQPGDMLPGLPIVILVNEGTASASEIVAGALQDQGRAIIMGTNTFGKGSVQTILPITKNRAVKLTTARYFTPKGRSIQAKGIKPDIKVPRHKVSPERLNPFRVSEKNLPGHLANKNEKPEQFSEESTKSKSDTIFRDYQLHQALSMLKGLHVMKSRSKEAITN